VRIAGRVLAGLLIAALCMIAVVLGARAWEQHVTAKALQITTPDGVQEAGFVSIDGVPQWVQIRGEHRSNPVLLFVHGGPGFAMSPLTPVFRGWERDFTVVQWDQRDAGRTFSRNGPQPISVDQTANDGIAVADYLRRRLGRPVIVLGHSWGSAVGLNMIHRRPELFAAYVGVGQMSSKAEQEALSYDTVLGRLRAARDAGAVTELTKSGPPPYGGMAALLVERRWLAQVDTPAERNLFRMATPVVFFAPGLSLKALWDFNAAPKIAQQASFDDVAAFEARRIGTTFAVPIFVIEGDQDLYTPVGPTRRYLDGITAPRKDLVVLSGGGHDMVLTMPAAILAQLNARVRPVAMGATAGAERR
jgi:pimeloyl-ACP methyl ester carboxylesterase